MCGIVGSLGVASSDCVYRMSAAVGHRGPDDHGIYVDDTGLAILGHRRLSILDLSPAGHQPMSYANGRYWITYNGEVYNFAETRHELEQAGHMFQSQTDTEVILAAYVQWGSSCLDRLRGMFAFAIWDRERHELFLARDRFGIKPLLYAQVGDIFLFASELKSLLASGLVERQADKQAIWDYLSLGAIRQPCTILAQVKSLLPGHYMVVRKGNVTIHRYWDIVEQTRSRREELAHLPYVDAVAELRRQLLEVTRYHLVADVPIGAFLSGGIDSTAVVGLMSQLVNHPIKTYSVGFESRHRHLSELKWAKIAAQRFRTEHTEVIVTASDAAQAFDRLIQAIDQPSLDGTNTYFVAQAARQGVTVALSGLGGDELFAGYPQFRRLARSSRIAPRGIGALNPGLELIEKVMPGRWRTELKTLVASPIERFSSVRLLLDEAEKAKATIADLRQGFHPQDISDRYRQLMREDLDAIAQISYMELCGYMRDTLLRDADAMSMAHALEVRPVLLDHVLAEFVFSLPSEHKLNGKMTKRILVDALRELLPTEIVERPKMGFEMPLLAWLRGVLQERALMLLDSPAACALFSSAFRVECAQALRSERNAAPGLWANVVLLAWLEHFKVQVA